MAYNLVREMLDYPELELSVYLLNEGTLADKLGRLPVDLTVAAERTGTFLQLLSTTRGLLNRHQPHIIHSHRYKENILAYLASRGRRPIRLVTTQHGMPDTGSHQSFRKGRLVAEFNRLLLRTRFDKVVGVSANISDYLKADCGIPAERVCVVNNGINLPKTCTPQVDGNSLVVGSAGRLFPVKDFPLMVEIANALFMEEPAVRFELIGEGPERSKIEQKIDQLRLEGVFTLPGHRDDINQFYSSINVYLNTSEHEGIPMSILEAMAYGLPVVAPNVGGIGEIITDGVDGFLVNDRRPESFAQPLLQLRDATVRRRIGEAAREKIRGSFSAQSMGAHYCQIYRDLLA